MKALRGRSTAGKRRWTSPWVVAMAALLVASAGGVAFAVSRQNNTTTALRCSTGVSCTNTPPTKSTTTTTSKPAEVAIHRLTVVSTSPAPSATAVLPSATVTIKFSAPIAPYEPTPTLSPAVAGSWTEPAPNELAFVPAAPFVPYLKYTLTIPGGAQGVRARTGVHLSTTQTLSFTVAGGSTLRLQQLLAKLGYLPLSYTGAAPVPHDMATPQPGTLTWRWTTLPPQLTGQWVQGHFGQITKGAVMMFETENGMTVDGNAGPQVWATLLADVASQKANTEPLTYVLVTKTLPQHLTAWVNGTLAFKDILVNTGVPGATTLDGTFQVFEHVRASDMKGCNVTGSCYNDPTVPWASYFNGGVALHGFPRASYGYPQSNGCVEMQIPTAGRLWPDTPLGTVVTVQGPTAQPSTPPSTPPPPTTTTTKPPSPTTTTTTTTQPPPTTTTTTPTTTTTTPTTTTTSTTTTPHP